MHIQVSARLFSGKGRWQVPSLLSLPHSSLPVSPRKELVPSSHAPIFVVATQEAPLDCLALVANKAYAHWPQRTVTSRERVLKGPLPQDTARGDSPMSPGFLLKEAY